MDHKEQWEYDNIPRRTTTTQIDQQDRTIEDLYNKIDLAKGHLKEGRPVNAINILLKIVNKITRVELYLSDLSITYLQLQKEVNETLKSQQQISVIQNRIIQAVSLVIDELKLSIYKNKGVVNSNDIDTDAFKRLNNNQPSTEQNIMSQSTTLIGINLSFYAKAFECGDAEIALEMKNQFVLLVEYAYKKGGNRLYDATGRAKKEIIDNMNKIVKKIDESQKKWIDEIEAFLTSKKFTDAYNLMRLNTGIGDNDLLADIQTYSTSPTETLENIIVASFQRLLEEYI